MNNDTNPNRTIREEVEVAGTQLMDRIKELAKDSSTRRVIVRNPEGEELISLPLTVGVVAGGVLTLYAPLLAGLGAIAALVTRVKLEIIREEEAGSDENTPVNGAKASSQAPQE